MKNWIQLQILENLIRSDVFSLILVLVVAAWLFYKIFLPSVSEERHRNLRGRFSTLFKHTFFLVVLFLTFNGLDEFKDIPAVNRFLPYVGFLTLSWGSIVFVQACRILLLQYLFLTSMRAGVPLLLVNIFTLVISLFLGSWIASALFGIQLAPLLATSAAFSLILGLALQDTLGNLFAGISLQLDHTFEIGDWLEITSGTQKIVGKVKEITWRAVFLDGIHDEEVIVPNRFLAQSQVSNWTRDEEPIARTLVIKLKNSYPESKISLLKEEIQKELKVLPELSKKFAPTIAISEVEGQSVTIKVIVFIDDYGKQTQILDKSYQCILKVLELEQVELAIQKIELKSSSTSPTL